MSNEILHIVSITVDLHKIFSTMSGPKFPELCPFIETIIYPYRIVYVATFRAMKIYIVKEIVSQTTSIASCHLNDFLWFTLIPVTKQVLGVLTSNTVIALVILGTLLKVLAVIPACIYQLFTII